MTKKMKKGFTLAELLIVVAIIAVLTAIAVPLFVTSLNKAEKATKDANIAAVREAAVVAILSADAPKEASEPDSNNIYTLKDGAWVLEGPWLAKGTIANGKLTAVTIEEVGADKAKIDETHKEYTKTSDTITVYVVIDVTTLPGDAA